MQLTAAETLTFASMHKSEIVWVNFQHKDVTQLKSVKLPVTVSRV